jgi:hypothetical protein
MPCEATWLLCDRSCATMTALRTLIGILVLAVIATAIAVRIWVSGQWTTVNGLLP